MFSGAKSALGGAAGGAAQLIGRVGGDARVAPDPEQPDEENPGPSLEKGPEVDQPPAALGAMDTAPKAEEAQQADSGAVDAPAAAPLAATASAAAAPEQPSPGGESRERGLTSMAAGVASAAVSAVAPVAMGAAGAAGRVAESAVSSAGSVAGSAATVAGSVAGSAGSAAVAAGSVAGSAAGMAGSAAGSAATAAGSAASAAAQQAKQQAEDMAAMSKEKVQDMVKRLREFLETWVKAKLQAATERAVDRLPGIAKNALEDPEMPRMVSRGKDRLIDNMWPDLREEILWEVAVFIDGDKSEPEETPQRSVDCFRAFWRYNLEPFDTGIWGKLRNPVFIGFKLFTLVPVFGVSQFAFLFVFLIIDKGDEFQLIKFILDFKGTQFISMGIIRAITGFAMFMMCVTAKAEEGNHDCEDKGPGGQGPTMLITSIGFVLQVSLVWIAFTLLRCASEKGRTQLKGHIEHEHQGVSAMSGGYIRYFLWYDLFFFCIACCLPLWVVFTRPKDKLAHDDWVLAHVVFAAQIVYGMLSFPFFLFTIPGLQRILTHAMPTAYDRQGRCRKIKKATPPKEEPKRPEAGELVSEEEAQTVFQNIRGMIFDRSFGKDNK